MEELRLLPPFDKMRALKSLALTRSNKDFLFIIGTRSHEDFLFIIGKYDTLPLMALELS